MNRFNLSSICEKTLEKLKQPALTPLIPYKGKYQPTARERLPLLELVPTIGREDRGVKQGREKIRVFGQVLSTAKYFLFFFILQANCLINKAQITDKKIDEFKAYYKNKQYDTLVDLSNKYLENKNIPANQQIFIDELTAKSLSKSKNDSSSALYVRRILKLDKRYKAPILSDLNYKNIVEQVKREQHEAAVNNFTMNVERNLQKAGEYFNNGQYQKVIHQLKPYVNDKTVNDDYYIKMMEYLARSNEKTGKDSTSEYYIGKIFDKDENYRPPFSCRPHYKELVSQVEKQRDQARKITTYVAGRKKESVPDIPASVVIIDRKEIETMGYMTLTEILENVPGMYVINHYSESDITLGIRGFWSPFNRNVMIMVNGVSMLSERQNDYAFNRINVPVESIDRIEIVRGPMSVIYGAGAFFGVINIITNDASQSNGSLASVSLGTQNPNRSLSSARAVIRIAGERKNIKTVFNLSAYTKAGFEYNWNDFISNAEYAKDSLYRVKYRNKTMSSKRYNRKELFMNLSSTYKDFYMNAHYAETNKGFSFINPAPGPRNGTNAITAKGQLGFRHKFSNKFTTDIKGTYSIERSFYEYRYNKPDEYAPGWDNVNTILYEGNAFYTPSDKLNITFGLFYKDNFRNNSVYDATGINLPDWYVGLPKGTSLLTSAIYSQLNYRPVKRLKITLGLRVEEEAAYKMTNLLYQGTDSVQIYNDLNNDYIQPYYIPRAALIYKFRHDQYLKLLYGQAINMPTVVDNAFDVMSYNFENNTHLPYLKPQEIHTSEINYIAEFNKKYRLNTSIFYNTLTNLIVRQTNEFAGTYATFSSNIGQINTLGTEITLRTLLSDKISGSISLTYQRSNNKNKQLYGDHVSFSPKVLGYARMSYQLNKYTTLSMNGNYVGSMYPFYDISKARYIGETTKPYFLCGATLYIQDALSKIINVSGFDFRLRVSNILNTLYHYPTYTNNAWSDKGLPGRQREVLFGLTYKF